MTSVRYLHDPWARVFPHREAVMIWLWWALAFLRDDMYHEGWEDEADFVGDLFGLMDDYLTSTVF